MRPKRINEMGLIETIDVNPREGIWENFFVSDGAQWSQPQYHNLSFLKHLLECKILGKQDFGLLLFNIF